MGFCRLKKLLCILLVLAVSIPFLTRNIFAADSSGGEEKKVITVACFEYEGYFQVREDGSYYGYGFEYLDEIAKRTGWSYEYKFGTWPECITMLQNGDADIMPMLPKNETRQEMFEFTENETNSTELCLFAKAGSGYAYEDFENFNNMRIGVLDMGSGNRELLSYCEEHDFTVERIGYPDMNSAKTALDIGRIDAIITGDLADVQGYMVIADVGTQRYYIAAPKGETEIIAAIDDALEDIQREKPKFTTELGEKYFRAGKKYIPIFTSDEAEYIKNIGTLRVALYSDRNVLSRYDDNTGSFAGVTYDIMKLIEEKSGLTFEYSIMPDNTRGEDYFAEDMADIIAPITVSRFVTFSDQIQNISTGMTSSLVMIGRRDHIFNASGSFTIVLDKNFFGADKTMKSLYKSAEVLYADSPEECFAMVVSGEADVTFDNRLVALSRMRSPYYRDELTIYESYAVDEEIKMMLPISADEKLVSILEKTVDTITGDELDKIIINNTVSGSYEYSVAEIFYSFRYYIVIGIVAVSIMFGMIVFILVLRRKGINYKEEKERLEEKRESDEKYQRQLYRQANYDSMTGLLNRNGFYDRTRKILDENPDVKFVILRGDIDQFKVFNDIMGVKLGDELIKHVANMWKEYFAGQLGSYGYLGGDDYICCMPFKTFKQDEVMKVMQKWFEKYMSSYAFSVSLGAYVVDDAGLDVNIMCDRAELALARAKKNQEKHFCFYEQSMREQVVKEQAIINYIPVAFTQEQFEIYLQPQYDSMTRRIVGAEALTRWNHPEQGMVSPGVFIPIMEENGMITELDMYVVEHVCRVLHDLYVREMIPKGFSIAVNLSRVDTFNNNVIEKISEIMERHKIPVEGLRLEITESAYIEQSEQVSDFVNNLKERGFLIEMDDFGSGYSSLNTLKDVPVDTLKLDLKFLAGGNTKKGGIIISSVIRMAKWLGIPVIAEGVETAEQAEYLKNIGCQYMQGFYFAKPMPVDDFMQLLAEDGAEGISRNIYGDAVAAVGDVLDSSNAGAFLVEKIGPLIMAEYCEGNLEAVMQNDSFYELFRMTREQFEKYQLHIQEYFDESEAMQLIDIVDKLSEKETVIFKSRVKIEEEPVELNIRIRMLSKLENRKSVMLLFDTIIKNG